MSNRVQVILTGEEREAFRQEAAREGKSLSAWLRDAGRRCLAEAAAPTIRNVRELRAFFDALPERDADHPEPDWSQHVEVIESSRARDRPST